MLLFNLHEILLCNICTLVFAVATMNYHDQMNLQNKEFTFNYASKGAESIIMGKA